MKTQNPVITNTVLPLLVAGFTLISSAHADDDPRTSSWFTAYSGKYARIYTTDVNRTNGVSVTTWTNGTSIQPLPAYCGVQEAYSSSNWVYIRSTGLGSHIMGAWYLNAAHTQLFPNYPTNQKTFFRIPRTPTIPTTKSISGGGAVGYFVDGVAMFNNWDAQYWNGTTEVNSTGTSGYWNRDAYVNEGPSFDPANAHQPGSAQYHYHANPPALRYLMGDHVDLNPVSKIYSESSNAPTKHSPILGWVRDGIPIYGPYGYSSASNSASGIRRMVSGYVLRNGAFGTSNLTANGRTTIPAWAARLYNVASNILAGPAVSVNFPLGRYLEDNDYLGDRGYIQGVDFDLDEYNGRGCVTPEFPNGTYAYFVSINSNGTPVFPYNFGFGYYGSPTGGSVTTIGETVATNFLGNTNLMQKVSSFAVSSSTVTLTWSAVEGGSYRVDASTNLTSWSAIASNIAPVQITGSNSHLSALDKRFYRIARTGIATFDPAGTTTFGAGGGNGILNVSPTNATRGASFTLTINLDPGVNPPPQMAPVNSVTIGSIAGTGNVHTSGTQVTSSISIPGGATTGPQTVTVVFPGPPDNPSATVTYTLPNGFTIN